MCSNNGLPIIVHPNKDDTKHSMIRRFARGIAYKRLKISPKKCQLFRKELKHMGHTIFMKERRVCIKPLRSRLEAFLNLNPNNNHRL